MSNIESFDYRRKSLGQLQRQQEQFAIELKKLHEYRDWQDMVMETLEVQFSEFRQQHEFMVTNLLEQLKKLNDRLEILNDKR